jgi:hypothetical protein
MIFPRSAKYCTKAQNKQNSYTKMEDFFPWWEPISSEDFLILMKQETFTFNSHCIVLFVFFVEDCNHEIMRKIFSSFVVQGSARIFFFGKNFNFF